MSSFIAFGRAARRRGAPALEPHRIMTKSRLSLLAAVTLTGTLVFVTPPPGAPRAAAAARTAHASGQPSPPSSSGPRFTTLPGFSIERVVPPGKLDSYIVLTFDSLGRLVVSKENDHPRLLLDADGDGVFEAEKIVSDKVRNCQGLWFDGRTLYGACAPVEPPPPPGGPPNPAKSGLYRMEDTNGDDVADTVEQLSAFIGGIQEHGPHAIRRGPLGDVTVMVGNNTFVQDDTIDPLSPLRGAKESQLLPALPDGRGFGPSIKEGLHGTIVRFDREKKQYALLVGGLRNAYDHAFNLAGEAFTFDSDMEWDINMPWYREVRSIHGIPGGNYGYRNGSGKFPPYYLDSLPPLRDLGRGSPVGVEFYQHHVYPSEFHDAYLEADWSRGRLLWTGLRAAGATYAATKDKDEFVHGEPLNITDVEVGPDGFVYFSIGGRGTEGGVFRVRYTGAPSASTPAPAGGVLAVVRQPQPLSSWGWAAIDKARASMGDAWTREMERFARAADASPEDRAQAVLILQRHGPAPGADLLTALIADSAPQVRAAAVLTAGAQTGDAASRVAAAALKDADPFVRRRAAEALVRQGLSADRPSLAPVADIYGLLNDADRFVRYAGRIALERTPRAEWRDLALNETNVLGAIDGAVALIETASSEADLAPVVARLTSLLQKPDLSIDDQLRLLRAVQLAAIDTKIGAPALRKQLHDLLIGRFPARDERLNRELAVTLAWAGQPAAIAKILAAMPSGDANQPLQIHYVSALRAIKGGWTKTQKAQMVDWYAKAAAWRGGASFPGFINLLFDASLQTFTPAEKKLAYAKVPQFAPLTEEELAAAAQRAAAMRAAASPPAAGTAAGTARRTAARPPAPPNPLANQRPATARARGVTAISKEELAEELIFTPQRQAPSLADGRVVYDQVCAMCHRFGSIGTDLGPDLTTLNSRFQKKDIVEAILWPSKAISDQYDVTLIETTDGKSFAGFVVREEGDKLVMRTADVAGRPFEVLKQQIKSRQTSPVSMMPDSLIDPFSQQQIAALIAFLQADPPKE